MRVLRECMEMHRIYSVVPRQRVGIMGGTFNPIHIGHLEMAEYACKALRLDQVLFITAGDPPHKPDAGLAMAEDRLEMVRLAISDKPQYQSLDIEVMRGGQTYTLDTLRELHEKYLQTDFFFLMGTDAFLYLPKWMGFPAMLPLCTYAVFARAAYDQKRATALADQLALQYGADIILLDYEPTPVSSTILRERIEQRLPLCGLVPEKVERYIREKGVYARGNYAVLPNGRTKM